MALKMRKNKGPATPEACPLLECMAIIGGAWTPNIIWYLRGGSRRFSELRADIPQISPKILTTRLRELEECGVIERTVMPTSPPSVEYALNELGRRLVPAIEAIAEVGEELKRRAADGAPVTAKAPRLRHFRAARASAKDAAV
jgi:DNA-binding HxlR family transcriptional regulator